MWLFCDLDTDYVRVTWDGYFSGTWRFLAYCVYAKHHSYNFEQYQPKTKTKTASKVSKQAGINDVKIPQNLQNWATQFLC